MSDSKTGSKSDLNESNMPLLDEEATEKTGETPEKEQIEMEEAEKDDSGNEKAEKADKKKKEKKEKKAKKEKKEKGPCCIDTMTTNLDLKERDGNKINEVVDVSKRGHCRRGNCEAF